MELEPTLTSYVALDLLSWKEQGALLLSPKFQRRSVWSSGARSYFIDTLLRGYPVPALHLRLVKDPRQGLVREVIDGQQRLRTLFDFIEGKFRMSKQLGGEWAGRSWDELSPEDRGRVEGFTMPIYLYQSIDDAAVLEIFSRINTYSVALNAQELRHGKYFGDFRQSVYRLSLDHLTFWRDTRVFTEGAIARMKEAELVSELLILQMDGMQDKKKSIDDFYRNLDVDWNARPAHWTRRGRGAVPEIWLSQAQAQTRFGHTISAIYDTVGDDLAQSEFRRVPLFYTLFAAFYHREFGLPGFEPLTPKAPVSTAARTRLRETMSLLSELLSGDQKVDELRGWQREFVLASARQTDNVAPRRERLQVLWDQAELSAR